MCKTFKLCGWIANVNYRKLHNIQTEMEGEKQDSLQQSLLMYDLFYRKPQNSHCCGCVCTCTSKCHFIVRKAPHLSLFKNTFWVKNVLDIILFHPCTSNIYLWHVAHAEFIQVFCLIHPSNNVTCVYCLPCWVHSGLLSYSPLQQRYMCLLSTMLDNLEVKLHVKKMVKMVVHVHVSV